MALQPNVVLILADDMGYSDLGCFGGEIHTPNLDHLAANGQAYTQFYNTARCCPTRASLLTGLHPHQTGIGHMTNTPVNKTIHDHGVFGYRGFLNHRCVTIAEVLQSAGYHTYMAGKWHLGEHEPDQWPTRRGFERFYGIRAGACNYLRPAPPNGLFLQDDPVAPAQEYYSTDAFTTYACRFIEEQDDDRPFFLYLAFNAPHWPLQAPQADVAKYRGRYLCGWDAVRQTRYRKMVDMGLIDPQTCRLSPRDENVPDWNALTDEQKQEMDLRMAVYAAQIDRMDQNVGRVVDLLRERGQLDNTLILFLSDNGACAEGGVLGAGDPWRINNPQLESLMVSYGRCWANVSNTPFRLYKRYVHEGGVATPLIAHWPQGIRTHGWIREPGYLIDVMPTLLEVCGAHYPEEAFGNPIPPLEGKSLAPVFRTGKRQGHEMMFWEHEDHCAIRWGEYKALQEYGTGQWRLYDLGKDRSELEEISQQHPEVVKKLAKSWDQWAAEHHVSPKWAGWKPAKSSE